MSRQMIDLTGRKFGRLTVLRPTERRTSGRVVWECKCDCGNMICVASNSLLDGDTKSCGCLRKENSKMMGENTREDLQGQRFGKLTAIRALDERTSGQVVWECRCDCGRSVLVLANNLRGRKTRSCGCLQRESKDLTGLRFGRLVALKPTDEHKQGSVVWKCKCDCGNETLTLGVNLVNGRTRSCGCLQKERVAKANGKDLTGQRFGNLTAIRPTQERRQGYVVWECKCDCGKSVLAASRELNKGRVTSCGCKQSDKQ